VSRPVLDDSEGRASLIVISPDQRKIVRLAREDGRLLGECPSGRFTQPAPAYLLRVGDRLAAVSPASGSSSRIAFAPIAGFEAEGAAVTATPVFDPPGVWGRVSVVGEKLLAPISNGLAVIDPAHPEADPLVQALDEPGNILALGQQLLVVDDSRAHSYLQWETAEGILTERMRSDPKDPTPAVTFSELAYRAGRPERIAASVDAALAAIALEPELDRNKEARTRLFETVNGMVTAGLEPAEVNRAEGAGAAAHGRGAVPPRIEDRALLALLVDRLGSAAQTADDRVAVALAQGRLAEQDGGGAVAGATRAAALYQKVLDDPHLATANWRGGSVSIRGELEAARRLEQLIAAHGAQVYAAQEEEARRKLAEAGENATAEQLEQLASRFPLASTTPEAYLKLYSALKKADGSRSATNALELGLKAAQRIKDPPATAVGELAGRLVTELRTRRQTQAAAGVLRNLKRRFPTAALTADGQPLDAAAIEGELARTIAAGMRWPRIGQLTPEHVQTLAGWALLRPVLREQAPHVNSCLAMESDREIAVFGFEGDAAAPTAGVEMKKLWTRRVDDAGATLIKITPDAAYFLARQARAGGVEKAALGKEGKSWKSEPLSKLFPPDEATRNLQRVPGGMADQFETPDDGIVPTDDLIVAMDERTLALVQRGGRAVALDTDTGELLWSASAPISRVYDAQLAGGVLVVAGDAGKADPSGAMADVSPTVQVVDARTGRMGQRIGDLDSRVRWVRITDEGALICGLENKVVSLDLAGSQRNWTIENADVMPAAAAWVFGDRLLMMSTDRSLWLASVSTGRLNPRSLDAPRSHIENTRELEAFLTTGNPDGPFAVATQQGLMIFGPAGELDGVDGLGGVDSLIPPRPAEERAVTVETVADGRGADGLMQFRMQMLETGGGMLVGAQSLLLGARPVEMELMDGRVAVTAGAVTVIVEAPGGK
jgi:hypothetical protein